MTIENQNLENSKSNASNDPKEQMLAALAKKQKVQKVNKSLGLNSGSKVGAGQTASAAPKMHRRKAGSA